MKPQLKKNTTLDKIVKKFYSRGFQFVDERIKGQLKIKKVRLYEDRTVHPGNFTFCSRQYEVDFIFEGELMAINPDNGNLEWLKSDIVNYPNVSKIKVNKVLRRKLENRVLDIMELFGVDEVKYYGMVKLKKVTWI